MDDSEREELIGRIMDGIEGYIGTQSATYIDYYMVVEDVLREWSRTRSR